MTSKNHTDEKTLASRCLSLVFKEKKSSKISAPRKSNGNVDRGRGAEFTLSAVNENSVLVGDGSCAEHVTECQSKNQKLKNGAELFEAFINENKCCYWNPHLEESLKNLRYAGCLTPWVVLVTGRDIYLDTVRGAWGRRVLRPPMGFSLHKVGEVASVHMEVIPQTQFTPLPEALCLIISQVNRQQQQPASFDTVLIHLKALYHGLQQPAEQLVYETLGSLIKDNMIVHTGDGYFILTPDIYQQYHPIKGRVAIQDSHLVIGGNNGTMPAIYIPVQMSPAHGAGGDMRSISCQTEEAKEKLDSSTDKATAESGNEENEKEKGSKKKLERSHSMRDSKKKGDKKSEKEKGEKDFMRSASMRYGEDKAKELIKDINLKTSDVHQDKDKGEKTTLFSKLFGRHRSKTGSRGSHATPIEEKAEVEMATFSAQFPPPELEWYQSHTQQQQEHQQQQQQQQKSPSSTLPEMPYPKQNPHLRPDKSYTWHYLQNHQVGEHGTPEEGDVYEDISPKYADDKSPDCPLHRSKTFPLDPLAESYGGPAPPFKIYAESTERNRDRSLSSDSWYSLHDRVIQAKDAQKHPKTRKSRHHHSSGEKRDVHQRPGGEWHVGDQEESGPPGYAPAFTDEHAGVNLNDSSLFSSEGATSDEPFCFKGGMPESFEDGQARVTEVEHVVPSHPQQAVTRPHHAAKVFRKYREMKTSSGSGYNDISVEYFGKMPRKGAAFGKSRDSGVNCIGLSNNGDATVSGASQHQLNNRSKGPSLSGGPQPVFVHNDTKSMVVEAQIHRNPISPTTPLASQFSHLPQEDSGFNSPRAFELSENGTSHSSDYQLNNHASPQDSCFNGPHSASYHNNLGSVNGPNGTSDQQIASKRRSDGEHGPKTSTPTPIPKHPQHHSNGQGDLSVLKENPDGVDYDVSSSSLRDSNQSQSVASGLSGWSDSSKQTVVEVVGRHRPHSPPPPRSSSLPRPHSAHIPNHLHPGGSQDRVLQHNGLSVNTSPHISNQPHSRYPSQEHVRPKSGREKSPGRRHSSYRENTSHGKSVYQRNSVTASNGPLAQIHPSNNLSPPLHLDAEKGPRGSSSATALARGQHLTVSKHTDGAAPKADFEIVGVL